MFTNRHMAVKGLIAKLTAIKTPEMSKIEPTVELGLHWKCQLDVEDKTAADFGAKIGP